MFEKICEFCGEPFQTRDAHDFLKRRFCSISCSAKKLYEEREVKPHGIKREDCVGYDLLYQLYVVERLTVRAIAKKLGFKSKGSIQNRLREYGIEARDAHNGLLNRGIQEPTRDELIDFVYVQHLRYEDIGVMFGVDKGTIGVWLKKHNIPRPTFRDSYYKGKPPTLPTKNELITLYESGQSLTNIGKDFGVSATPIRELCEKYGIEVKPDGWNGGKRFQCKDGHLVRSTYEQRVDDWLFEHDIPHMYEPPLPCDKRYHADFSANGWYIEIWGVTHNQQYADRRKKKTQLYHQHGYPLIELNTDFFQSRRRSNLEKRLAQVLAPVPLPLFRDS